MFQVDYLVVLMPKPGKNEETVPVKLLSKVFSNSLGRIVSYTGTGNVKIKLKGTNILTLIECNISIIFIKP